MEINKKALSFLCYSMIVAGTIIIVVGCAGKLSGLRISATTSFWLWTIVIVCLGVMFFSLIRIILDFLPIEKRSSSSIQTIPVETEEEPSVLQDVNQEPEQEDSILTSFNRKYVSADYINRPIYLTLKKLFEEEPGGKSVVLTLVCAKDMGWLISFPSYNDAKTYFEEIGSKSNFSTQKSNYADDNLTEDRREEKRERKKLLKKTLDELMAE